MLVVIFSIFTSLPCLCILPHQHSAVAVSSTFSLHDALPILQTPVGDLPTSRADPTLVNATATVHATNRLAAYARSEEHTSELQSPCNLVCRLLLEKKQTFTPVTHMIHASEWKRRARAMLHSA